MSELPQADSADTDAVQMALQAAHTLWSRGDTTESLRWLKRAAESASDEGADLRSLQLAKAAAELRARLFPTPSAGSQPASPRPITQRELTGVRPAAEAFAREAEGAVAAGMMGAGEPMPRAQPEEAPPSSRAPSSAPQYVVHRPREAQRQLMGLSSSTMETARQHNNGASYASVPSWSAGSERRPSSPPPLPSGTSLDDYEELDAEPVEDSDAHSAGAWAQTAAPTWRPQERSAARNGGLDAARRESAADSSPRVATLPPPSLQSPSSSPPPLPELSAFGEDDGDPMRAEQPTMVIPPQEERAGGDPTQLVATLGAPYYSSGGYSSGDSSAGDSGAGGASAGGANGDAWDSDPRMSNWDSSGYGWGGEPRAAGWSGGASVEPAQTSESTPAKLTARVHHQAVRVSFAPDPRVPGQYVVRALREGERPSAGERVALLVALEPGVPLV